MRPALRLGFLALAAVLSIGISPPAGAQCTWPVLSSGVPQSLGHGATPQFTQGTNYWMAVGSRGPVGDDWDLTVHSATGAFPTCVGGSTLATSTYGGSTVDFVIGDFNTGSNPYGTYYARSYRYSGTGTEASVEWDNGMDQILVNDFPTQRSTGPGDVLECWDVYLEAGKLYTINLGSFGSAITKLFLFRDPAAAPYWVGRTYRVLELEMNTTGEYTPPATGWYGIVVTNENGSTADYRVSVGTCDAPLPLTSATPVALNGQPNVWRYFDQPTNYYSAVAVRSDDPGQDWDLAVYGSTTKTPFPHCFENYLVNSTAGSGRADVIIGDFNGGANPLGRYYAHAYPYGFTTSDAHIEWDDGAHQLAVDGPSVVRTTGPGDIIECWDVHLTDGQWYTFDFAAEGADLRYLIVRNPGAGFWVNRFSPNVTELSASEQYIAQSTDWYAVVVVNDNGAEGSYRLGVSTCPQEAYPLGPNNTVFSQYDWKYAMSIHPDSAHWFAFATRSRNPSQDWDLTMYRDFTGGSLATGCASGVLATSTYGAGAADYVVGYRRYDPPSFVFPLPYAYGSTTADGLMMWDQADPLTVDAPAIGSDVTIEDIVDVYDVDLEAGSTYRIEFGATGAATLRYSVFGNPTGATFWAGRSGAMLSDQSDTTAFSPPATGRYAIVVSSESESTGDYTLRVARLLVAAGDPPTGRSRIVGLAPNPAYGATRIRYELAAPGPASFAVYDLAGRKVATLTAPTQAAGPASFEWNGRADDGSKVGAGVYFLSLVHNGEAVGASRLVLMR